MAVLVASPLGPAASPSQNRRKRSHRQQELWEELWWEKRRDSRHPHFRLQAAQKPLCLHNQQHKLRRVESQLRVLHDDPDDGGGGDGDGYDVEEMQDDNDVDKRERRQHDGGDGDANDEQHDDGAEQEGGQRYDDHNDGVDANDGVDDSEQQRWQQHDDDNDGVGETEQQRWQQHDDANDGVDEIEQQRWQLHDDGELMGGESSSSSSSSYPSRKGGVLHDVELLRTLCKQGYLNRALEVLSRMDTAPSNNIYLSLLKACNKSKALTQAKKVHAHLTLHRAKLNGLLGRYLVETLAKCGAIKDALQMSSRLPHRTVFTWTAIISAYTERGHAQEALKMHHCMREDGVEPDSYTLVSLLKACGSIRDLGQGKSLHAYARKKGLASNVFVGNTLVSMYGKCGAVAEAEDVFAALSKHDFVSWNAMLSAYVEQGQGEKALQLYRQMQAEGMSPNQLTFVVALQACSILAEKEESLVVEGRSTKMMSLEIGQALHADAHKMDFTSDVLVGTALLRVYGKCGAITEAGHVFCALSECDIVSWTAMLSAYVEHGQGDKSLQFYKKMQQEGVSPDQHLLMFALQACTILAEKEEALVMGGRSTKVSSLEIGRALHADAHTKGFTSDGFVGTALVNMYGKCGAILEAEEAFGLLSQHNLVSWTAMLSAYVEQGQGEKALQLYRQMQKESLIIDDVTVICILQACSETGTLEICKELHFGIMCAGYEQIPFMAATLIHAYANCASMVDAQAVFDGLLGPNIMAWTACIAGHAGKGNSVASLQVFEDLKLAGIEPDGVVFTSVLSACSHIGLVIKGFEYFESMSRDYGITLDSQHYGIMLDLLGRAGDFKGVDNIVGRMPMLADLSIWLCLLRACRTHGNLELAKQVFGHAVNLDPKQDALYVLMSNIYADAGLQECADKVDYFRQRRCTEDV